MSRSAWVKSTEFRWWLALGWLIIVVLLGGGTANWTAGITLAGAGAFIIVWPPERSPGQGIDLAFIALLALICLGFLPLGWLSPQAEWAEDLQLLGVSLPSAISVQPWVSFEASLLAAGGMAWLVLMLSWPVDHEVRKKLLRGFSGAVVVLSVVLIFGRYSGMRHPFSPDVQTFSFFPNKNQTGTLLALGGVVSAGLFLEAIRRRRLSAIGYAVCCLVVGAALVLSLSRAGLLLFVAGCALLTAFQLRRGNASRSVTLIVAGLALGFSLLVFLGGGMIERLTGAFHSAGDLRAGFRAKIFGDAFSMIGEEPLAGVGLGNFPYVFPQFRDASVNHNFIKHPESDWIWLATELGIPGMLCVGIGIVFLSLLLAQKVLKKRRGLSAVSAVCLLIFLLHSLVDVPGHRLGTVMAAGLVVGLALHPERRARALWLPASGWRVAGGAVLIAGSFLTVSSLLRLPYFPSVALAEIDRTEPSGAGAAELAGRAVELAPMEWRAYFNRGLVGLMGTANAEEAAKDFRIARFLEPVTSEVLLAEGLAWLRTSPVRAEAAWSRALGRATDDRDNIYRTIARSASVRPDAPEMFSRLSRFDLGFRFFYLTHADAEAFERELQRELDNDPLLSAYSSEDRAALFGRWLRSGNSVSLIAHFENHPELRREYWKQYGLALGQAGEVEGACEFLAAAAPEAAIPEFGNNRTYDALERAFRSSPTDIVAASAYLKASVERENWQGVYRALKGLGNHAEVPTYVNYWRARVHHANGDYKACWDSWRGYFE